MNEDENLESEELEVIREVKLKTLHMFDNQDCNDRDYLLWKKIAEYMDGEIATVIESASGDGKFVFLGLEDEKKNKELFYMMEQDSMMGAFIDDREEFDRTWDDGHYEPDNCFYLEPENVMFDCEKKQILKNDLISKSALLEKLKKMQFDSTKETLVWAEIYQLIEEVPVTYNPDKVEEQVGEEFERIAGELLDKTGSELQLCDFNIKPFTQRLTGIIKEGGVNGKP